MVILTFSLTPDLPHLRLTPSISLTNQDSSLPDLMIGLDRVLATNPPLWVFDYQGRSKL